MPKGRHLKPEFFTDRHIVSVSPLARLLYQGLWCYAADCGHLDDEPFELKMRILPADNCDVDELLGELSDTGRIERKDGVIYLPKLSDHARVDKRYETACERCKARRDHDGKAASQTPGPAVTTTSEAAPGTLDTQGSRSEHSVTTQGPQREHDADGDGDGDGDGEVMVKKPGASADAPAAPSSELATIDEPTAQTLVGEWIDHCAEPPPSRVKGHVAREVKQLLDDGIAYERVRVGLAEWNRKGLHPSTIASVVHEQANRQPTARRGDIDWDAAFARAAARDAENGAQQ